LGTERVSAQLDVTGAFVVKMPAIAAADLEVACIALARAGRQANCNYGQPGCQNNRGKQVHEEETSAAEDDRG
jgi:hypothetical protein